MKKTFVSLLVAGVIVGIAFSASRFVLTRKKGEMAGIRVVSSPQATIFLDSKHLGRTPFEGKLEPGEFTLKLIPESSTETITSWQGRIKLSPEILTYVSRELGSSDLTSAGEILTLEKTNEKSAEIAVISNPDGSTVRLDNEERGTSPLLLKNISPGDHELSLSSPGFKPRSVKIKTTAGYKLSITFQLALTSEEEATKAAEEKESKKETKEPEKPYVKILETSTGWLRVRMEPSTTSTEAAKVNPGETYSFLEEKQGWYKIRYGDNKEGWVSGKYAEKVE